MVSGPDVEKYLKVIPNGRQQLPRAIPEIGLHADTGDPIANQVVLRRVQSAGYSDRRLLSRLKELLGFEVLHETVADSPAV
jgi:hypothetical protein